MKICFLGTPNFVKPVKDKLAEHFTLVKSLDEADLGVVAAYGHILSKEELEKPKFGCLNIHPSLLPKYRGPSPVQATILNGDQETGVTIIKMDQEIDHGPIIIAKEISLSGQEDFTILITKLFQLGIELLIEIIPDFTAEKIKLIEQDHSKATFTKLLTREDGYFDINNPPDSEKLDRMIRAYSPWPGVWTRWNGKIVKFLPSPRHPRLDRGSINIDSRFRGNDNFLLQMEGGKPTPLKVFLNNYPHFPLTNY